MAQITTTAPACPHFPFPYVISERMCVRASCLTSSASLAAAHTRECDLARHTKQGHTKQRRQSGKKLWGGKRRPNQTAMVLVVHFLIPTSWTLTAFCTHTVSPGVFPGAPISTIDTVFFACADCLSHSDSRSPWHWGSFHTPICNSNQR